MAAIITRLCTTTTSYTEDLREFQSLTMELMSLKGSSYQGTWILSAFDSVAMNPLLASLRHSLQKPLLEVGRTKLISMTVRQPSKLKPAIYQVLWTIFNNQAVGCDIVHSTWQLWHVCCMVGSYDLAMYLKNPPCRRSLYNTENEVKCLCRVAFVRRPGHVVISESRYLGKHGSMLQTL